VTDPAALKKKYFLALTPRFDD